jgi:hypothetical protein
LLYPCRLEEPGQPAATPAALLPRQLRLILAWSVVSTVAGLYYILPASAIATLVLLCTGYWRLGASLLALLVGGCLVPMHEWPASRRFFQLLYEVFDVRHNVTPEVAAELCEASFERGERFILGMHPHGVVPIQCLLWAAYADQYLRTDKHGTLYGFGGMASVLLYLPALRSLMGWLTGGSASYATLKRGLTTGSGATFGAAKHPGRNLYMLPGGMAEIFTAAPGTHTVLWRQRRGLCRLALETGARLIPLYVFGGNDFFHQGLTSESWLARCSRSLGASLCLFWGSHWWMPCVPLVPPHGVSIVVAPPLPSRRAAAADGVPSDAEIASLNAEYEAVLRKTFDEYKAVAGYPTAQLVVK